MRTRRPPRADADWAWFLDVDGTLLPHARTPEAVRVSAGMRSAIDALSRVSGGAVALVTGRRVSDLDRLFPRLRIPAVGQHGGEHRTTSGRIIVRSPSTPAFEQLRERMVRRVARHPGLRLEDKGLSLALHFRGAPRLAGTALRMARAEAARLGGSHVVQAGRYVIEIRSSRWNKGSAVRSLMRKAPFRGRVPVFLGDDVTDEDAFAAINDLGGISVKVGRGPTAAHYRLPGVPAVRAWLRGARRLSGPRRG